MDSDWGFIVVEPLTTDEVREVFTAAAPAFKEPYVGRKLRGAFVAAGFVDVTVEVQVLQEDEGGFAASSRACSATAVRSSASATIEALKCSRRWTGRSPSAPT